jgi:hypothetical protein
VIRFEPNEDLELYVKVPNNLSQPFLHVEQEKDACSADISIAEGLYELQMTMQPPLKHLFDSIARILVCVLVKLHNEYNREGDGRNDFLVFLTASFLDLAPKAMAMLMSPAMHAHYVCTHLKVFVGNVDFSVSDEELFWCFTQFGPVQSVRLQCNSQIKHTLILDCTG